MVREEQNKGGESRCFDIAVIGAGVIGCAVARELSRYQASVCVIEREEDVCCGTTKANSAIIHAGFDAQPGSHKAYFNVLGNAMMDRIAGDLAIPFVRNGSLVVCTKDQDRGKLDELLAQGAANGVPGLRILERDELIRMEPNLADDVTCALYAPTGGIVCPFHMTFGYAENAAANGVEFFFDRPVTQIRPRGAEDGYEIAAGADTFTVRAVVIAAGVYADVLHNAVCEQKLSITARRGEYQLLDKAAGKHVSHTVFQLPGPMGKGVLVTPTVHGNLLVGPTAADTENKDGTETTAEGLASLRAMAAQGVKDIPFNQTITSFAGLRAHEAGGDFVIGEVPGAPLCFEAAGIESPGLSSAPAIGDVLARLVAERMDLAAKEDFIPTREGMPAPLSMTEEEHAALIKAHPAFGRIICRCETVSEGEIVEAVHRVPGARSLDGVKRRTRAGMGRCQAGFCSPRVMEILERELGLDPREVTKSGGASCLIVGENKHLEEAK